MWLTGKIEVEKGQIGEGERSIKDSELGRSSCLHPNCWPICFFQLIYNHSLERSTEVQAGGSWEARIGVVCMLPF